MPGEQYRLIFISGPTHSQGFTNPRRGGSSPRIPNRDRQGHSAYLKSRLDQAWANNDRRQAVVHTDRQGTYIEFAGEAGFDLAIKSLEDIRSGVRLQNVHKEGDGESQRTFATVFIPHRKRGHFLKKINSYSTELTSRGKPKNAKLINSISDIKLAVLESFWSSDERLLIPGETPQWIEVWLSTDNSESLSDFEIVLETLQIESQEGVLSFPERSVKLICANRGQLTALIEHSDQIAEFRIAKEVATFYSEQENREQLELVRGLLNRLRYNENSDVVVCILDSGVNNRHPLIEPFLANDDLHTVRPEWGVHDSIGHGTLVAGTAIYRNLLDIINGTDTINILHHLESAKILPPPPDQNPRRLWGLITAQGISRVEIQASARKRIVCLTTTATDDRDRGRPSSWSGEIDEITSGATDDKNRLIVVSAGNVDKSDNWRNYPEDNLTNEVHDPGQSWNALTVGAFTKKIRITDSSLSGYSPIAPSGGLSPFSTTSFNWPPRKWPIKPDVVFEGGNVARGPNESIFDTDDLKLLSTHHNLMEAHLAPFWATSAAAAQAACMAAQVQAHYPQSWPETIRGLIVHSAEWTDTMRHQFLRGDYSKAAYARLLRICGYGVPNLEHALYCAANSLTLISQATLQPFDKLVEEKQDANGRRKISTRYVTRDMHLYNLPWPKDVLSDLGELPVTMRVTLSYFVEPAPGEIGWEYRYRYASHALRFDVNGPGEEEDDFVQRVNEQARDDGEHPGTVGISGNWMIGEARNVGSIHSDIWQGRAADLASSNLMIVYPAVGWWRERVNLNKWNKTCRYALIVSIRTPEHTQDIYTPVAIKVAIPIPVQTR